MDKLQQLQKFAEWEHENRPAPDGKQHIAAWAALEIARLRARVLELEVVHEDASGSILQAVSVEREECARLCENDENGFGIEGTWCAAAIRAREGPNAAHQLEARRADQLHGRVSRLVV